MKSSNADYFLLSGSNEDDVYRLSFKSVNRNPNRVTIPKNSEIYSIIKEFYTDNIKK